MPSDIPLTPEAARVVAAFDAVMDRAGVLEGSNDALAAALRELVAVMREAHEVAALMLKAGIPESRSNEWGDGFKKGLQTDISGILAIAENIEQAITYSTETPTP